MSESFRTPPWPRFAWWHQCGTLNPGEWTEQSVCRGCRFEVEEPHDGEMTQLAVGFRADGWEPPAVARRDRRESAAGPTWETTDDRDVAERLVPDEVRVTLVRSDGSVRALGNVAGYFDHPVLLVRLDDGSVKAWSARLIREDES